MQSGIKNLIGEKERLIVNYKNEKKRLKENIAALFQKYNSLSPKHGGDALVNLRKTSRDMISEIDFLLFPCTLMLVDMPASRENANYYYATQIYTDANNLISHLLTDKLDSNAITAAKNKLANNINAYIPETDTEARISHGISAFKKALVIFAAVLVISAVPFVPIGIGIGLLALGVFAGGIAGAGLIYNTKVLKDSARNKSIKFSNLAEEVVNAILPPSL